MSGAEAAAVLGLISSIISIVDGTKKVYDAATNAQGLPEAFRKVADRLPIIENILNSTYQYIKGGKVNNDAYKGVEQVVKACEENAKKLEELFHKIIPGDDASRLTRYIKAVKVVGKGGKVENIMKEMLEDVQLLTCERGINTVDNAQQEQIIEAIAEVSAISPSVPGHEFHEAGSTYTHTGSGTQNNVQGTQNNVQDTARQYNNSNSGDIHFVDMHNDTLTQYFSAPRPNEDEAYYACLSALFLTNPRDDRETLITTKGPGVDGTCQWIKSHALYDSWLRSHSQLLWLSGGPGKGKTMLSIFLATELEKMARPSQNKLFLQYFCDNKDEKRNTAVAILRGLIFQLLQLRPELFRHILPTFKIQKESLVSFETLWRIFESMVCDPTLGTTYCVLDGLDECDEALLKVLLRKFATLLPAEPNDSSACHLNLLIVSRDLPDVILLLLSGFPRISLDTDANTEINKDIDLFITAKVKELSEFRQYSEKLRRHVEEVFRVRAQGTFLWIGIVAQALDEYKATEVEEALDRFPSGLDKLYARILLQIKSDRREIAASILRWVVMAVRPLTLSELSITIETTVGPSSVAFTRDERIRDQVSYCGHFLVIKENKVGLIHQSAKDYLLRKSPDSDPELEAFRVKEEVANLEIARKCLDYLESGALKNREYSKWLLICHGHLKDYPLLRYAALHWHEHARFVARSGDIFDLSRPFYHEKSQTRMSWLKEYWESEKNISPLPSFNLLHLASCFGILPLVENLVLTEDWLNKKERSNYLNIIDGEGMTALIWAAMDGHEAVVRLLLEKGADIEAKTDYTQKSALIIAAAIGHEAIVRLLLEKGADIDAKTDYTQESALIIAADRGHESIVRLLLEKGAVIEAGANEGGTALMKAAESGRETVERLLLEKGADIQARDNDGMTALLKAAKSVHETVIQLLLTKGADINAKDASGETALMKVTKNKYKYNATDAVIRLLLEKGADIQARDNDGGTALMKAAESGQANAIQLLLTKGADINVKDKNEQTALMRAAEFGRSNVLKVLVWRGADFNAKDKRGESVWEIAARSSCSVEPLVLEQQSAMIASYKLNIERRKAEEKEKSCEP